MMHFKTHYNDLEVKKITNKKKLHFYSGKNRFSGFGTWISCVVVYDIKTVNLLKTVFSHL
jgi:hypothetical protein